jgi:Cytochrome P450
VRDEQEHRTIRRAYEHGMREQVLNDYESRITDRASVFARLLKERGSEPMDVSYWFKLLVVDINNRVSFSKESKSLETGKKPSGINYLEDGTTFLGLIGPIPWFFILLLDIPTVRAEFNNGAEFCRKLVAERLEVLTFSRRRTHKGYD